MLDQLREVMSETPEPENGNIVNDRQRSKPSPNMLSTSALKAAFEYMSKVLNFKLNTAPQLFIGESTFPYYNHKSKTCMGNRRKALKISAKRKRKQHGVYR